MVTCRFLFLRAAVVAIAAWSVQVASSAPGGGASWTTGGYDAQNTRYNKTEAAIGVANVGALVQKWRLPTEGDVSATPAVDSDTVYAPDFAGNLYAVDRLTGALRWRANIADLTGIPGDQRQPAHRRRSGRQGVFSQWLDPGNRQENRRTRLENENRGWLSDRHAGGGCPRQRSLCRRRIHRRGAGPIRVSADVSRQRARHRCANGCDPLANVYGACGLHRFGRLG